MRTLALLLVGVASVAEGSPATAPDGGVPADGGSSPTAVLRPEAPPAAPSPPPVPGRIPAPAAGERRPPQGVPAVFAEPRLLSRGPMIDLPPDEEAPRTDGGAKGDPSREEEARTSYFSDIKRKAEAILNRTVLGGYGEFVFTKRADEDSYFEARRFVALLHSQITDRISFTTEIEFEHGGSPLKRDGQLMPGEVALEFAALDVKLWDQLTLRGGIVLVPFGRFNVNHDAPTQDLTDRPLAITLIIPSTWYEVGAGLLGRQRLSASWELGYEGYVINGLDSKIQDGLGYRAARGSKLEDSNDDKAVVGRVGLSFMGPVGGRTLQLDLGASGYTGAYDRRGSRANLVGGDLTLKVAGFELLAEYARGFNDPGFDDDYATSTRTAVPAGMQGLFVELHYHVMFEALRRRLPGWLKGALFTLALRYDLVDTDLAVKNEHDRQRLTFGLNFRPIAGAAWKHELQLDHTGGPQNPFASPRPGYVTSIAFLF